MGKSSFKIPVGWKLERLGSLHKIVSPEGDLSVAFLELSEHRSFKENAAEAWKLADPAFQLQPLQEASPPTRDGWDEIHQIIYDTPSKDSSIAVAAIRVFRKTAYVNLIQGTNAAMSRRGAQVSEAVESWKPEGLEEPSLAAAVPMPWSNEQTRLLERFVRSAMGAFRVPGTAIAVVQDGRIVYTGGFGVRKLGGSKRVTPATVFMIGSTTKALTTLMIAKLVEQGRLNWSTPVAELLPGFALADKETTRRLQIQHTACACTGMPRDDLSFIFKYSGITAEQRLEQMKEMRPTTGLGETFQYSNWLVMAGGYAAARVFSPTGTLDHAYRDAMREMVLGPLGMKDTFFEISEAATKEAASPHAVGFNGKAEVLPLSLEGGVSSVAPAGAAWSNVLDLARYLLVELDEGFLPNGTRAIGKETLLRRRQKGIKINDKAFYGLGLFIDQEQGLNLFGHGGNTLGFSADLFFIPEKRLGVVVLTNLAGANSFLAAVRQKFLEIEFGAKPRAERLLTFGVQKRKDWIKKLHERVTENPRKMVWLKDWVGEYENERLGLLRILAVKDGYEMDVGEWKSRLGAKTEPNGDHQIAWVGAPWSGAGEFLLGTDGKSLILDEGQRQYVFRKR
jgi:CubicO group peptidase (beta-lactamase class C family)